MKSPLLATASVVIALLAAGIRLMRLPTVFASDPDVCEDGPVPVVWPLGPTGFEPRPLFGSNGQYLQFETAAPYVHEGIDITACAGEAVYAVEDGTVVYKWDDASGYQGEVRILDADDATLAWTYVHLVDIAVDTSEAKKHVLRGQLIGFVDEFDPALGLEHLHLARYDEGTSRFADDPLNWLTPLADGTPPRRLPFDPPHPALAGYLFFELDSDIWLAPHELAGKEVEIVGRVSDIFPGVDVPECTPITAACAGPIAPQEITPQRISFGIFHEREDPSGHSDPRKRVERVFHNVIDLSLPISAIEVAPEDPEPRQVLAERVYRKGSKGDYSERSFLVRLTNCQISGSGSFKFEESGEYLLQLVLEDASGNVGVFERTVEIP